MYLRLKKNILKVIPKHLLYRYEYTLRYPYYLKYFGKKHKCNICNRELKSFVEIENDKLCPSCGSIKRTRRLWEILTDDFLKDNKKILDFSPSRSIYRLLKKSDNIYISSDLSGDFMADNSFDITKIDSEDENFDLIICYHILEHVEEDEKAMSEIWRVLRKNGICIIQTPFKEGDIYENSSITSDEDREKHFGQSDHVRVYSINGLVSRLENAGLKVETKSYNEESENSCGFHEKETVLICHK